MVPGKAYAIRGGAAGGSASGYYPWPVHIEMLAKANGRAGRQNGEELLQQGFTILENHFCQTEPSMRSLFDSKL
jgi:hypothetical protein